MPAIQFGVLPSPFRGVCICRIVCKIEPGNRGFGTKIEGPLVPVMGKWAPGQIGGEVGVSLDFDRVWGVF